MSNVMGFDELLKPGGAMFNIKARCKREALEIMAERASEQIGLPANEITRTLLDREKLGSTGVGEGVAIPHAKLGELSEIYGFLALLDKPVSFDALDDQPVDLVFLLLAPTNATAAHLKALAKVSRVLKDAEARAALRGANSPSSLYAAATSSAKPDAA